MKFKIILTTISFTVIFGASGQNNSMIDSLENVLKTAKEDTVKVNRLNLLSEEYRNISDFEKAMQYAESSLGLADRLNYNKGIADSYTNIGLVYYDQGSFPEALKNYNIALKIREEIGTKVGIANSYCNIGKAYYKQGAFEESIVKYFNSLKIYEEIGDKKGIANAYNWIGNINKEQGNRDGAMKYYMLALKMREEIGDKQGVANTTENIGAIYRAYGNYPEALKNFNIALKIHEETGNKYSISHVYCNIGILYKELKNYSEALKNLQVALKISEEIGNHLVIVWVKRTLGHLYIDLKNYPDARKYLMDALSISEQSGNIESLQYSHQALARLNKLEGNFAQAEEHSRMYFIYRDSLVNASTYNLIAQMKIQYETEKKDREIELLNKDNELQKQQLEKQLLIRNGMIAGTIFLIILSLLVLRSIQLGRKLEKQKAIVQERNRISADLHDDFGSSLSEIFLLSDIVIRETKATQAKNAAMKIADNSRHLLEGLGEIIWALNSHNDSLESMVAYIRRYAAEYFENSTVNLKINTPVKLPRTQISAEHRRNMFYTVKEALHNIIKHAQATEAEMKIKLDKEVLSIIIKDNGKGMPKGELNRFGNGMINMQSRMTSIKGEFSVQNHKGTKVTLKLPVG